MSVFGFGFHGDRPPDPVDQADPGEPVGQGELVGQGGQAASPVTTPPDEPDRTSARGRLALAIATVACFLWGQLGPVLGWDNLGQVFTSLFLQLGPGVALALAVRPRRWPVFALVTMVVGPSVLILVGMATALTGAFSFSAAGSVLTVLTLIAVAVVAVRDARLVRSQDMSTADRAVEQVAAGGWSTAAGVMPPPGDDVPLTRERVLSARFAPTLLAVLGLALAVGAAMAHHGVPRPGGVAVSAGPLWFVGAATVAGAFGWAWRRRLSLPGPVLSLATLVVASQTAMYREPTVVVSARHIGLVEFLLANGQLDRSTDIYQAWAGLFSSAAVNVASAGITNVFLYAACWAVVAAPTMAFAVSMLARHFLVERRAWLAGLIFALASSLNTVFFAPQVIGFLFAITILVLLITPRGVTPSFGLPVRVVLVAILSVALAVTHQISPYMLTFALGTLVLFRLVRPWWVPAIPLAPAVVWALLNRNLLGRYVDSSAFGQLFSNLAPPDNAVGTSPVALTNRLTFLVPALALVVVGLIALYVLIRTRNRTTWALAAASASSVVIMLGTSYGNEGIFRVALFALPWLAILACVPLPPPATPRAQQLVRTAAAVGVVALLAVNVLGQSGMDWARVIRRGDVDAVTWVENGAPDGSVILALGTGLTLPNDSTARYPETDWYGRQGIPHGDGSGFPSESGAAYDAQADLQALTRSFLTIEGTRHYAIITDSMGAYDQRYGNQSFADHLQLAKAVARSPLWKPVYSAPGAQVYQLRAER